MAARQQKELIQMVEREGNALIFPHRPSPAEQRADEIEKQVRREQAEKAAEMRKLLADADEEIARNRARIEAEDREVTAEARRQAAEVAEQTAREGRAVHEERALRHAIRAQRAKDANERAQSEAKLLAAWRKAKGLAEVEAEVARVVVRSEPSVYGPGSDYSYFRDLAIYSLNRNDAMDPEIRGATERIQRHTREVEALAKRGDDRVVRSLADVDRRETRLTGGMTTAVNAGGQFVTPAFLIQDYAQYNENPPVAVENAFMQRPLPSYGMTIYVSRFTSDANFTHPAETTQPAEQDPGTAYAQGNVVAVVSEVSASMQLHQRGSAAQGVSFDQALYSQLRNGLDSDVESYACQQAANGLTPIAWTTYSNASLLARIGQASAGLRTAAGTKLAPGSIVGHPVNIEWLFSQVGSDGLPLFPQVAGQRVINGIPVYESLGLPTVSSGAQGQLLVVAKPAVYVYTGPAVFDCFPDVAGYSSNFEVLYRARQYMAVVVRYPAGVASIQGAPLTLTPAWAS